MRDSPSAPALGQIRHGEGILAKEKAAGRPLKSRLIRSHTVKRPERSKERS